MFDELMDPRDRARASLLASCVQAVAALEGDIAPMLVRRPNGDYVFVVGMSATTVAAFEADVDFENCWPLANEVYDEVRRALGMDT